MTSEVVPPSCISAACVHWQGTVCPFRCGGDLRQGSGSDSARAEPEPGVWPRPETCHDASRCGRTSIPRVPPTISLSLRNGPAAGVSERFRLDGGTARCLAETPDVSRRESLRPNIEFERPRVDCRLPCRDPRWARSDPSSGVRGPCRTSTWRYVTRACRPRGEPQTQVGDVLRGNGRAPRGETR